MSGQSLKFSLSYQTVYQVLNTIIPLITSPYLARVLGAEMQGVFSYTQSIVNLFVLFSMLGVVNYGTRTVASCLNNRELVSGIFWNIYIFQAALSLFCIALYSICIVSLFSSYKFVFLLQGIYLLGSLLDINWLFFGLEKFKTTVTRSIFVRLISVVLILTLVNSKSDLWIYTIIMAGSTFVSNGILWLIAYKEIDLNCLRYIKLDEIIKHIKPNIILFIPILGMSIYHIMDKTMLGVLSSYEEVGYYYNADKVINIPVGIISGIGTVMLPRMTSLLAEDKINESKKYLLLSLELTTAVSCALAFGIASISKEFTPFFFGNGFNSCVALMMVLSPVLIIKGFSSTARMQYLIPFHQEKIFIQSVFMGAFTNVIVNIVLIPKLGAMGAVIGTLVAEFISCFWQYFKIRKEDDVIKTLIKSAIYLLFGLIMFIIVRFASVLVNSNYESLLIEIGIGILVYSSLCFVFWKSTKNDILGILLKKI